MNNSHLSTINKIVYFGIMAVITLILVSGIIHYATNSKSRSIVEIEETIVSLATQCYALEGSYPADLAYLVENYGLVINEERYFYHYEVYGSNIKPDIKVVEKWRDQNVE